MYEVNSAGSSPSTASAGMCNDTLARFPLHLLAEVCINSNAQPCEKYDHFAPHTSMPGTASDESTQRVLATCARDAGQRRIAGDDAEGGWWGLDTPAPADPHRDMPVRAAASGSEGNNLLVLAAAALSDEEPVARWSKLC